MRTNIFHIVFIFSCVLGTFTPALAQDGKAKNIQLNAEKQNNITQKPLPKVPQDSIPVTDTIPVKKNAPLDAIVKKSAKDYEKVNLKKSELTLYNEAHLIYKDIDLTAGIIVFNFDKDEVYAGRIKDSLGNYTQRPVFKQGQNIVEPDSIRFNTKTKKALVWNSRTTQQDFKIKAEVSKRVNDSVYYMQKARLTTSEDIDNPEYYFNIQKVKFVPGEKVVAGVTNMVIADVPTPLGLPFGYFPITSNAVSGFIIPSFGDTNNRGYFIQNGGYYFAINDHVDLTVLGDYYTNGSWATRFESSYGKRYRYNGRVNIRFENIILGERGFPDYSKTRNYNIQWSHAQDQKANPYSKFSASVNMGSSQYFRNSLNMANIGASLNNTLSSSINYNKRFTTVPEVNLSITATHSQNTNTKRIDMTLPTVQASVDRIYPFAKRDESKRGIIKNINLQYNFNAQNKYTTSDSLFFSPTMFKDQGKTGFSHNIPLSTNFKIFKHFSVSASANYNEVWQLNTIRKYYDSQSNKVVDENINGFEAYRTYNLNTSIGTTFYGTFNFGKEKRIQAIRHTVRPSISYMYTPSFEQYYDTYALDASGTNYGDYTKFQGGLYGVPSLNQASNVGINIGNSFEAKVRDDEKGESKKVMLLNSLNIQTTYNLAADSLKLAPLRIVGGTALFNNKLNVNFGTTLDPYAIDNAGRRIDKWNIDNGGSLFRMTSANLTLGYSLSSRDLKADGKENLENLNAANGGRPDDLFGRAIDMADQRKSLFNKQSEENTSELYNLDIPWDIQFAYSLTYANTNRESRIVTNSLMVNGNLDITPRWKVGASTGYDFANKGVTFTQLRFERDLLSWRMSFNWVPIGFNSSWGFFIGIKSGALSDIKWDKRSLPEQRLR
ncbi:LPS-assembly protein LptD [Flavobacterium agricola]|uniref:LPS-assembly protein LptD n=1 Tax=Flavobacterium agricola TaxID=2870839 RepID=A0ABY6M312_9FLAO|nr:putative LPS assembly protein LptD [Flavobacterium agricola]UYW02232.1 LPS-assembly protein LptD [Flavobacterium agricola]